MKKISDVEHGRIKTEASRSAVVLSNGSIDNQGYLIRHVELREYIEKFDPKRGRYCLVTVLVQTDNEIIEMKYDEGYRDDNEFELFIRFTYKVYWSISLDKQGPIRIKKSVTIYLVKVCEFIDYLQIY